MELVQRENWDQHQYVAIVKSFLIWSFTLTVCLLVIGFPVVVLMMTVGALLTIILQSVLPISAVLLVAGSLIGVNVCAIIVGAAVLTIKRVHPEQVSWLRWLHGEANPLQDPVYAACPLTCALNHN
ncbi:MAG: hypothetical protein GDA44_08650 [Prochloron sp. SP5CPC1]|nr:hypothetical protein [Candidatus Paraprochloron terpiosi SP5CPC1]